MRDVVVHVGELHTEIRPAEAGQQGSGEQGAGAGRTAQDVWDEARDRRERLTARTAATAFDD